MDGRESVLGLGVHVGLELKKEICHVDVPLLGRKVERCEASLGLGVGLGAILKQ